MPQLRQGGWPSIWTGGQQGRLATTGVTQGGIEVSGGCAQQSPLLGSKTQPLGQGLAPPQVVQGCSAERKSRTPSTAATPPAKTIVAALRSSGLMAAMVARSADQDPDLNQEQDQGEQAVDRVLEREEKGQD